MTTNLEKLQVLCKDKTTSSLTAIEFLILLFADNSDAIKECREEAAGEYLVLIGEDDEVSELDEKIENIKYAEDWK